MEGSGWTNALIQAGIASSGTADSFLKVSRYENKACSSGYCVGSRRMPSCTLEYDAKEAWKQEMAKKSQQLRILKEFEDDYFSKHSDHHEEGLSTQRVFREQAVHESGSGHQ